MKLKTFLCVHSPSINVCNNLFYLFQMRDLTRPSWPILSKIERRNRYKRDRRKRRPCLKSGIPCLLNIGDTPDLGRGEGWMGTGGVISALWFNFFGALVSTLGPRPNNSERDQIALSWLMFIIPL